MLISFVSIKGGSGKTTWARELTALLAGQGLLERALDLNPENGDLAAWCQLAEIPCRSLYPGDLNLLEQAASGPRFYVADVLPGRGPRRSQPWPIRLVSSSLLALPTRIFADWGAPST